MNHFATSSLLNVPTGPLPGGAMREPGIYYPYDWLQTMLGPDGREKELLNRWCRIGS